MADQHKHEHIFQEIFQSDTVGLSQEMTHQTITLEMFDRGIVLHMEQGEALELAQAFTALSRYLEDN